MYPARFICEIFHTKLCTARIEWTVHVFRFKIVF